MNQEMQNLRAQMEDMKEVLKEVIQQNLRLAASMDLISKTQDTQNRSLMRVADWIESQNKRNE